MVYIYTISAATPPVVAYANLVYDSGASLTMMGFSVSGTVISSAVYVFAGGPDGNSAYGVLYVYYCATATASSCTKQYTTFSTSYNFVGTAVSALPSVAMGVIAAPQSGSGSYHAAFWPCTYTTSATTVGSEVSMPYASSSVVAVALVSGTTNPVLIVGEKDTSAVYVYYCTSNTACSSYTTITGTASTYFGYSVSGVLVNGEIYVAIGAPAQTSGCMFSYFLCSLSFHSKCRCLAVHLPHNNGHRLRGLQRQWCHGRFAFAHRGQWYIQRK